MSASRFLLRNLWHNLSLKLVNQYDYLNVRHSTQSIQNAVDLIKGQFKIDNLIVQHSTPRKGRLNGNRNFLPVYLSLHFLLNSKNPF